MDKLEQYHGLVWNYAMYNEGDVFQIAKLAKKLGRDYMADIVEMKADRIADTERRK